MTLRRTAKGLKSLYLFCISIPPSFPNLPLMTVKPDYVEAMQRGGGRPAHRAPHSPSPWRWLCRLRLLPAALMVLGVVWPMACSRQPAASADDDFETRIEHLTDSLMTRPARTDSLLAAFQQELTDSAHWWQAQVFRATARLFRGDTTGALNDYHRVARWTEAHPTAARTAGVLHNHLGVYHLLGGRTAEATTEFEQSYHLLNRPPKSAALLATAINLSDLYMQQGRLPEATALMGQSLVLCDSLGRQHHRAGIEIVLGQIYMDLQDFGRADYFFSRARTHLQPHNRQDHYILLAAEGNCSFFRGRYEEALRKFSEALPYAAAAPGSLWSVVIHANLGEVYLTLGRLDEARRELNLCRAAVDSGVPLSELQHFYVKSLTTALELEESGDTSYAYSLTPIDLGGTATSLRYYMLHYDRLRSYAARHHHYERAYHFEQLAHRYGDSLRSLSARHRTAQLARDYRRDTTILRQQVDLAAYRSRVARQNFIIVICLLAFFGVCIVGLVGWYFYSRHQQCRHREQVDRMNELRMSIVRNRMSPHYVFNVLGTFLPKVQRFPEIDVPLELLLDVLRGNLLFSGKMAVPLGEEVALVRKFMQLYNLCHGRYPQVDWQVDDEARAYAVYIPAMALQLTVENALKHAFPRPGKGDTITVCIAMHHDDLHMTITDNGKGYDPGAGSTTPRDTGTGLRLLTRTLDIFNRYNDRKAAFSIRNMPAPLHGTRVSFVIPSGYRYETAAGG